MEVLFLVVFSACMFGLAIGGAKASKKAKEMKMKQDIEIYNKITKDM